MTAHELMVKTNHYLIRGGELTAKQKENIVSRLLTARSDEETKKSFYSSVKFPKNLDDKGRRMYPIFYIPPYNDGKKYKTIYNQTPKTHIFSANMYELEIIRVLNLLAPNNSNTQDMVEKTLERLKATCFGYSDDGLGECFDASLVALRFLATTSNDTDWMQNRIDNYNKHFFEKKRPWYPLWYFWLCLSELPIEIAKPEILKYKELMLLWLTKKSCVMNSEHDKEVHPVLLCSLRNCICRFSEYEYIKELQPYINEKDGRLYFGI